MKLRDLWRNGLEIIQNWWRVILGIIVLIILIWIGYIIGGTGFGEYSGPAVQPNQIFQRAKTLWDWMELLIVPAVLAGGAYLLNESARMEAALQTYLDKMTELLLDKNLRESKVESEVRAVARARTLTVLRRLDKDRKGALIQFLYEADLIKNNYLFSWDWISGQDARRPGQDEKRLIEFLKQTYSIDWIKTAKIEKIDHHRTIRVSLEEKYLSLSLNNEKNKINLKIDDGRTNEFIAKTENGKLNIYQNNRVIDLSEADLSTANLRGANLRGVSLSFANLSNSNLSGANLNDANLMGANLNEANLSKKADLRGANLNDANLSGANLNEADLSGAILSTANLSKADLSRANLSWAVLNLWVDLRGADLRGADLRILGDMGGIYLNGAKYTKNDKSFRDTEWPEGFDPIAAGAICVNE